MRPTRSHLGIFVLFLCLIVWTLPASAAQVLGVQGRRVLILLTPDEVKTVKPGDTFYVQDGEKRLGVVRIVRIQNTRALAGLLKGRAQKGNELASTKGSEKPRATTIATEGLRVGALAGLTMTSMTIKQDTGTTIPLSGSGFSGKVFGDFGLVEKLGVRVELGMEQMVAEGDSDAGALKAEVSYLTGDLMLRYNIMNDRTKVFLASGMGIYSPMSFAGTAIEKPSMQTTLLVKAGAFFPIGESSFIPLQAEYIYYPSSKQITTSMFGFKTGFGFRW